MAGMPAMDMVLTDGAAVSDALNGLVEIFGARIIGDDPEYSWRHSANYVVVLRNNDLLTQDSYADTRLADGDVISLVPPLAGGSA